MSNTAIAIPEGFVSTSPAASLVFQSPTNWVKAEAEGIMVQGTFQGLTPKDSYGKENFQFEATADGTAFDRDGNQKEYRAGATIIINTSSNLASKMKDIELGTEVVVVYNGQNTLTKGPYRGKKAHSFNVLVRK